MRKPPRWSGLPAHPRCSHPGCRPAPANSTEAEDQGTANSGLLFPGAGLLREGTGGCPREARFMDWAIWPAISLALSCDRCSTIRKEWWFSPGWSTARKEVKTLLTSWERSIHLSIPGRMLVIKRFLNCCRLGLAFRARASHLLIRWTGPASPQ
jgi:hypothetical protein